MVIQEVAMDILGLKRLGLSDRTIARRIGLDRRTVKRYCKDPSVIGHRKPVVRQSLLDDYKARVEQWLNEDDGYTARWIFCRLTPLGYSGSYERVKLFVRLQKLERSRVAYLRFETEPAHQAQVDFAEFVVERSDGTERKYFLFVMILGYSRMLYAELLERCDLVSFLDAHIRAFEFFGGVPLEILYDRMKNVYIRRVAGKHEFNRALVSFATHYAFTPRVAPAYAPWVKGKVERPIQFVREHFWRGYGFVSLELANVDVLAWSRQSAQRVHGTTQQRVSDRFDTEKPLLTALPGGMFDTSYRIFRKVHKDCTICFDGNRYVVPHKLVGTEVVLRVKNGAIRLFADDKLIADYAAVEGRGNISDPHGFYQKLRHDREMNKRKYSNGKRLKGRARNTISPTVPPYASVAVEQRLMNAYSLIGGEVAYE
jgi:transposase